MGELILPKDYQSGLSVRQTEVAIKEELIQKYWKE